MEKERLEEVKIEFETVKNLYDTGVPVHFNEDTFSAFGWLIEQAEKVEKYEKALKKIEEAIDF